MDRALTAVPTMEMVSSESATPAFAVDPGFLTGRASGVKTTPAAMASKARPIAPSFLVRTGRLACGATIEAPAQV
jgi:hypothetical protein